VINVFVNSFIHPNPQRAAEIQKCIQRNVVNIHIAYFGLSNPARMTYQNFFDEINERTSDDDINVVSNIDIYFDDTIANLNKIDANQFVSLSRQEVRKDGTSYPLNVYVAKWCQDVWAWRGKIRISGADFCLGVWGCDNRIAYEAAIAGYAVINPSQVIMAYHNHSSGIHGDDYQIERIPGPQHFVFPQGL
jgi:hypothetical protein